MLILEIMGTNKMRASVAGDFYSMESLSTEEQLEYKATMGYNQI